MTNMLGWLKNLLLPPAPIRRKYPAFPVLTLEPDGWYGHDTFSAFEPYQLPEGQPPSPTIVSIPRTRTSKEKFDDTPPTPEMVAAYQHFKENTQAILDAILPALHTYVTDHVTPVADLNQFCQMMELSSLDIIPVSKESSAYIGLYLGCTWDPEHGCGILLHRSRVIAVGDNEVACDELTCMNDGGTHLPGHSYQSNTLIYRFGPKAGQSVTLPSREQKPTCE